MSVTFFNSIPWTAQCRALAEQARESCGLSHDLYVQRFSFAVDVLLIDMPEAERLAAVAVAREFDYASANERQQMRRDQRAAGDCCHGIARECCPCGCDDGDEGCDYVDFSPANCLGDSFDQLLEQLREEWDGMKSRVEWEISCAVRPFTGRSGV